MTYTAEQVMGMESGRELDRLVAEHVMQFTIYHYDKDIEENCYFMLMDSKGYSVELFGGERETEDEAWLDSPYYSTDIAAAWEVLEKMQEKGVYITVETYADFYRALPFRNDGSLISKATVNHPDVAVAISKCAALLAVMGI